MLSSEEQRKRDLFRPATKSLKRYPFRQPIIRNLDRKKPIQTNDSVENWFGNIPIFTFATKYTRLRMSKWECENSVTKTMFVSYERAVFMADALQTYCSFSDGHMKLGWETWLFRLHWGDWGFRESRQFCVFLWFVRSNIVPFVPNWDFSCSGEFFYINVLFPMIFRFAEEFLFCKTCPTFCSPWGSQLNSPKSKSVVISYYRSPCVPLEFHVKSRTKHSGMESVERPTVRRSILPSMHIMVGIAVPESFDAPLGCQTGEASRT